MYLGIDRSNLRMGVYPVLCMGHLPQLALVQEVEVGVVGEGVEEGEGVVEDWKE